MTEFKCEICLMYLKEKVTSLIDDLNQHFSRVKANQTQRYNMQNNIKECSIAYSFIANILRDLDKYSQEFRVKYSDYNGFFDGIINTYPPIDHCSIEVNPLQLKPQESKAVINRKQIAAKRKMVIALNSMIKDKDVIFNLKGI